MSADTSTTKPDLETRCRAMFERDTRDWEVKILHDEGLYRHFIARNNRRFGHHAEIVTVPHSLTISTGFGSATFRRIEDMLNFFGTGDVNADYWAEKCDTFTGRAAMRGWDYGFLWTLHAIPKAIAMYRAARGKS